MTTSTQWQLARAAAEQYQAVLTPAILGPFARALTRFAALRPGERVLDVGCGTGAAARAAAAVVGPSGHVTGVDVNPGMIDVARSLPPVAAAPIDWRVADATALPLQGRSVDVVLCAQTLQFLPDKEQALSEIRRVLKPGARLALSLWCDLEENPYFHVLTGTISRHLGAQTAAGLGAAFALTATDQIHDLLRRAGFGPLTMAVTRLNLHLPPAVEFIPRHIGATPMAAGFSRAPEPLRQRVVDEVAGHLRQYHLNGQMQIPFSSHLIMALAPPGPALDYPQTTQVIPARQPANLLPVDEPTGPP